MRRSGITAPTYVLQRKSVYPCAQAFYTLPAVQEFSLHDLCSGRYLILQPGCRLPEAASAGFPAFPPGHLRPLSGNLSWTDSPINLAACCRFYALPPFMPASPPDSLRTPVSVGWYIGNACCSLFPAVRSTDSENSADFRLHQSVPQECAGSSRQALFSRQHHIYDGVQTAEQILCQAGQKPQGILCGFPRIFDLQ